MHDESLDAIAVKYHMRTNRLTNLVLGAALLACIGAAHGQASKLAIKDGAWATQLVTEVNGEILRPDRSRSPEFQKNLVVDMYAKGFVVDGERVISCNTSETRAQWERMRQEGGCKVEVVESTAKLHVTRGICQNTVISTTTAVVNAETTTSESRITDTSGTPASISKSYGGSTWLGSDCKAIMEERYAAALSEIVAHRAAKEEREATVKAGDTQAILQGLLTGLQEYAANKGSSQRKAAPASMPVTVPQVATQANRQPVKIVDTPPKISVGPLPEERNGQGQCNSTGNTTADKKAHDRCECDRYPAGATAFVDQGSKGWSCTQLRPSKLFLFGCSVLSNGKLSCTQL